MILSSDRAPMAHMIKRNERILLLEFRGFGDAIIKTSLLISLAKSFPNMKIDLFARSSFKDIFANNPYVNEAYFGELPMLRGDRFNFVHSMDFLHSLVKLRKNKYDICLNSIGDFRENTIGFLINPQNNISVLWEKGHPFNHLIRAGGTYLTRNHIFIPKNIVNVYEINYFIVKALGGKCFLPSKLYVKNYNENRLRKAPQIIGIHPLARQACRLWDFEKWCLLCEKLREWGFVVWVFCASVEKNFIQEKFGRVLKGEDITIQAGSLSDFFEKLLQIDLLIGLDSLSIHAAYACNVPSIMLAGPNDYLGWNVPPNSQLVHKNGSCKHYPCFNRPKCEGEYYRYNCMESIQVEDVINVINNSYKIIDNNMLCSCY
jgi:heptosyltransferase-3